jgi:hypothetical protein
VAGVGTFDILERTDGMVGASTPPFRRSFKAFAVLGQYPAYLQLWVKTGYDSNALQDNARVVLNGTEIGRIPPRPWVNHFLIDYDVVPIDFAGSLLRVWDGFSPTSPCFWDPEAASCKNDLDILPPPGSTGREYVLIGKIILHYQRDWKSS